MAQLLISKTDFLGLAAIIAKRPLQDEQLEIIEEPLSWKIQSIHPETNQHTLVAYVYKNSTNVIPIPSFDRRSIDNRIVDNSEVAQNSCER